MDNTQIGFRRCNSLTTMQSLHYIRNASRPLPTLSACGILRRAAEHFAFSTCTTAECGGSSPLSLCLSFQLSVFASAFRPSLSLSFDSRLSILVTTVGDLLDCRKITITSGYASKLVWQQIAKCLSPATDARNSAAPLILPKRIHAIKAADKPGSLVGEKRYDG